MNSFKQQLEQYAQWTQECLEQLLPPQEGDRVTEAMRYSLLAGGKRLRAALALEFCRVLCGDAKRALTGACAGAGTQLFAHPRRPAVHGRR